ncbi:MULTISPECIES: hypothetical protein [unclassified Streptomyces]|uniref:hypothetical protein n=1 Tax=unclassified Streptomyces TaxID=2593676 RepID=UPI001F32792D|nr:MULTISPECIES: hypothetical protein [unclassified Streptomyces]WKX19124.1 hypothetical protein Q3Y68_14160 [Streptomyces sp. HUAS CX7]
MGRRWVRAAAGAAALWWAGATGAAAADGARAVDEPDVAVVVWAGDGRTASWHAGESDFDRLRWLLDPGYTGTEQVPEAWTEGRRPPVRFTVLWGLTGVGGWPQTQRAPGGDVAMLRQDQFFLTEDGTPWVRSDLAPDLMDDDIRWHRASRRAYERMRDEGFFTADGTGAEGGDGGRHGVWWAAAGLGTGVAGTLLIRRAADRYRAGPPRGEPRQELIDL